MKKLLLNIFLLVSINVNCQKKYLPIPDYWNREIVERIVLENSKSDSKILLYKPKPETCYYTSVLLISDSTNLKYWILRNDTIIKDGSINNDMIFKYDKLYNTGATESEKLSSNTFIPPVMSGIDTEIVIYREKKNIFYFEYGKNITTHSDNSIYIKNRKEWLDIIHKEIENIY